MKCLPLGTWLSRDAQMCQLEDTVGEVLERAGGLVPTVPSVACLFGKAFASCCLGQSLFAILAPKAPTLPPTPSQAQVYGTGTPKIFMEQTNESMSLFQLTGSGRTHECHHNKLVRSSMCQTLGKAS